MRQIQANELNRYASLKLAQRELVSKINNASIEYTSQYRTYMREAMYRTEKSKNGMIAFGILLEMMRNQIKEMKVALNEVDNEIKDYRTLYSIC